MIYTHDTGAPLTKEQWDYNFQQLATRYELATGTPMSVILRQNLNRALMNREVDSNFQNLDAGIRRLEYGDGPYPVLDQTFVGASFLDPRITHTRPGKSWRTVNGVIREYDVNEPVLTPGGWSLRPAETNYGLYSRTMGQWSVAAGGSRLVSSMMLGPAPGYTMMRLEQDATTGLHRTNANTPAEVRTPGNKHTVTFFAKRGEVRYLFANFNAALGLRAVIDLETGDYIDSPGTTVTVTPLLRGIYLVNMTGVLPSTPTPTVFLQMQQTFALADQSYPGVDGEGLYVSDVQFNLGDPIPYIPTTDSAVTRPADNASIQGADFADVFNPVEGAIVFDCDQRAFHPGSNNWVLGLSDGTTANLAGVYSRPSDITIAFAGPAVTLPQTTLAPRKYGISWGGGSFGAFMLGDKKGEKPYSGDPALLNRMQIGGLNNNNAFASAISARRLTIFNRRPSDAQMEAMTS